MTMKSVRLNAAIREDIENAMVKAWENTNKVPCDIKALEKETGDKLYAASYPNLDVSNIPRDMLRLAGHIEIAIDGKVERFMMNATRAVRMQNRYHQIPNKAYRSVPPVVKHLRKQKEVYDLWERERTEFREEIKQILSSVNTTKQLVELWPEADQYLPPYASDPSQGINLPALKTSRLNAALGLKK